MKELTGAVKEKISVLGRNIARRRRALSLKQADLAVLVQLEPETISRIETGKSIPSLLTIQRIARALATRDIDLMSVSPIQIEKDERPDVIGAWLVGLADEDRSFLLEQLKAGARHFRRKVKR